MKLFPLVLGQGQTKKQMPRANFWRPYTWYCIEDELHFAKVFPLQPCFVPASYQQWCFPNISTKVPISSCVTTAGCTRPPSVTPACNWASTRVGLHAANATAFSQDMGGYPIVLIMSPIHLTNSLD